MTTKQTQEKPVQRCPYCSQPIETPVKRTIIDRGYDNVKRKQVVRKREMEFCSAEHGAFYQMGCEG